MENIRYGYKTVEEETAMQGLDTKPVPITVVKKVKVEIRCSTCNHYRLLNSEEPCRSCLQGNVHGAWE